MIVPGTVAVGGGRGSGGAAFRVGAQPPRPRGYVDTVVGVGTVALSPDLQLLVGPLTPMGATAYDTVHLTQGAAFETVDPSDGFWNYYDRVLALYMLYYRTSEAHWRDAARALAFDFARGTEFLPDGVNGVGANDPAHTGPPPARDMATLGLAVYYLDTGDTYASTVVDRCARWAEWLWPLFNRGSGDAREASYALMAMIAAHMLGFLGTNTLGDTHAESALASLNSFLSLQSGDLTSGAQPNTAWQNKDFSFTLVPSPGCFILNYMNGLTMEALILYDRVFGDARIVPALKLAADWQWATQWVPLGGGPPRTAPTSTTSLTTGTGTHVLTTQAGQTWLVPGQRLRLRSRSNGYMDAVVTTYSGTTLTVDVPTEITGSGAHTDWDLNPVGYPGDQTATGIGCMQYANIVSGTVNPNSNRDYACLMGMLLPAWGYLYQRGQGAGYKTNGDTILAGAQQSTFPTTKQFTELFRSSPRYLGFTV